MTIRKIDLPFTRRVLPVEQPFLVPQNESFEYPVCLSSTRRKRMEYLDRFLQFYKMIRSPYNQGFLRFGDSSLPES